MVFRRREELGTTKQLKKRVTKKKSSSERRFKTGSLGSQFKAPAIPATAPPSVPSPPPLTPAQTAIIESAPAAGQAIGSLFTNLSRSVGNFGTLGSFLGRYLPPVARISPMLLLSGLGPQPQPGRYDIPSGGTPQWRAKYPDMASAYDTQRRQDASIRRLRGLANFYATRSARR